MYREKAKIYRIRIQNAFTIQNVLLMAVGICVDVLLPKLLDLLQIPLYLDCIGCLFVGIMGGWLPGMFTALESSCIEYIGQPVGPVFGFLSVLMAGCAASISKRGLFRKKRGFVYLWLSMVAIGGVAGSLIGWNVYGRKVAVNIPGAIVMWFSNRGFSDFGAQFAGDMMIEVVDKTITVLVVFLLLQEYPRKWRNLLPYSYIYKCTDEELEQEYQKDVRPFCGISVYDKIIQINNLALVIMSLVVSIFCIYTYRMNVFPQNGDVARFYNYVVNLFSVELVVIFLVSALVSWNVYHTLEKPIRGIVNQSVSFSKSRPEEWLDSPEWKNRVEVGTNDELQVLYQTICQTEIDVVNKVVDLMEKSRVEKENIELQKSVEMSRLEKQVRSELEEILADVGLGTWSVTLYQDQAPRMVADEQMKRLLGIEGKNLSPEETYDAWFSNIMPEDLDKVSKYQQEMIENGDAEITYRWNDPVKGKVYIRCGGHSEHVPGKGHLLKGYHSDVTAQVRKEKEQRIQTDAFIAVAEEFDYIFFADLDANTIRIIYTSSNARTNVVESLEVDKQYDALFANYASRFVRAGEEEAYLANSNRQKVSEMMEKYGSYSFQYRTEKSNKNRKNYEVLYAKTQNQTGKNTVIIAARCIDEIMKQNQKLEQALEDAKQANAAKTSFLSRISHDIRTPLNGIVGFIEMGERHEDDVEMLKENRKKAKVAANHLLSLINDVLELTKLDDTNVDLAREPFDARELVDDVLTIVRVRAVEAGVSLEQDNCPDIKPGCFLYGSPLHVRQVFLNIFDNAIKYNHPGGVVKCKAKMVSEDAKHMVFRCTISDTGVGMSPAFMEKIFEPFTQEHQNARSVYQGTGLGMPIVKMLLEKMGGTIDIESQENVGSTFIVEIPFDKAQPEETADGQEEKETADISGVKVLLVEDNQLNMEIAELLLEDAGAVVTKAWDGKQAVETFADSPQKSFDVILMDVMMPEMDGMEATRAIRKLDRPDATEIPIIAMTANAFAEDVKAVKEAGMNDHIAKPIRMDVVMETIAKHLR